MEHVSNNKLMQIPDWSRSVLDQAPIRIYIIDRDGVILYSNQEYSRIHPEMKILGMSIYQFLEPDDHERVRSIFTKVLQQQVPDTYEVKSNYTGFHRTYISHVVPILEKDGKSKTRVAVLVLYVHETITGPEAHKVIDLRYEELEKRMADRSRVLQEYSRYLDSSEKLNTQLARTHKRIDVLQILAEHILRALNASFSAVYRLSPDWIEYEAGVKAPVLIHRKDSLEEGGLLRQIIESNTPRFFSTINDEFSGKLWRNLLRSQNIKSFLIAPLNGGDAFTGILYLGYQNPTQFDEEDEKLVRAFVEATNNSLYRINVMQQLKRNIHSREQELSVLYDLSMYSSEAHNLQALMKKSLNRILKAVRCDAGQVFVTNHAGEFEECVSIFPHTGIPEAIKSYARQDHNHQKLEGMISSFTIEELPIDTDLACISVPVLSKGKITSFLRLYGLARQIRDPEAIHLITSAAKQVGLAIESVQDRKLAEEAIILEERQRLARNLHDSITQSLYGLTLSGDVAAKMLDRGNYADLQATLGDITNLSLQAIKEMRLMLFELRPMALENEGLIQALNLRLETVERRSGMDARLEYQDGLRIPERLEIELYHMISEALNNSLRHSGAHTVTVSIKANSNMVSIKVEDDGIGFDMKDPPRGGLGLNNMNERARKLGGDLSITSELGKGTRIYYRIRV